MIIRFWLALAVGFGFAAQILAAEVFPAGSQWRYLPARSEASQPDATAWRRPAFDDSSWTLTRAPFYYGENLSGTLLGDMRNNYTSIFLRKTFVISSPNHLSELTLRALSDDGFIAWINGKEFARYNMPAGQIPYNGTSSPALPEPIPWENYTTSNPADYLVAGTNIIAVQAFNSSLGASSDFVFDAALLVAEDVISPVISEINPTPARAVRALTSIEVIFSEPVINVDAADLLVNGLPATSVRAYGPSQFVFEFSEIPKGQVSVQFASNHGITDLARMPNPFGGGSWSYTVDPDLPLPGVIISEFMADNDKTINDEDGQSEDWLELHNSSTEPVNLSGWFLSGSPNNLAAWRFPNVTISPNAYLLIFASGKNRTNPAARLHTNFKIAKSGGFLALSNPSTNVVSAFFQYPPQIEDVSYGRDRVDPNLLTFFPKPTPGGPNSVGGVGFAPEVIFSERGGTFFGSKTISLGLQEQIPGAEIRYVLGTNMPTEVSPRYTAPITISTTTHLRARAFAPGLLPGKPRSESYIGLASTLLNFKSDLPIIILHNHGGGSVSATVNKFLMMQVFEPKNGWSSLTNAPDLSVRGIFRLRGSSTQGYAKGSFALEINDEFGDDQKEVLLGMPKESDWVFYAPNNFEPVLIHNPFMHQLSREVGRYSPRTRFAEVYLVTSSGLVQQANYNGIYVVEEKIKRGPDRVNVSKLEPEHLTPPAVTGGYIFKIDRSDPGDFPFTVGSDGVNYVEPKRSELRPQQQTYIESYFREFYSVLSGSNYRDPVNGYRKYIDVDSWIDHHVLNVLAFNVDALRLSTYFHKDRNGKITYGPLWDFDRALGSTDGRDSNPRVWSGSGGTDFFYHGWWALAFRDPDFWQGWIDRWQELRASHFSLPNLHRLVDQLTGEVRQAQPREQARWGSSAPPRGGYQGEIDHMKNWLSNRVSFIDSQLVPAPQIEQPGGAVSPNFRVSLRGPANATIHYKLDGTDPRLPGGALDPTARTYTGPITLTQNARLVARAYNPNHSISTGSMRAPQVSRWSGKDVATFVIQTPPLVITEIMFHPAPVPAGSVWDTEMFEFLELKNRGASTLSLLGFSFTNGISYTFTSTSAVTSLAPGERLLLVKNREAFISRYGAGWKIAGEYTGSLDNSGERITLVGPLMEPIHDFTFNPAAFPITSGNGFSLVIRDESAPLETWGTDAGWRASSRTLGSPGAADPAPSPFPLVLVNELLTHTDLPLEDTVELFNAGSAVAQVGGWFLSDNFSTPRKFRIPDGTQIPPGGYLLLDETHFNPSGRGFSFSSKGEEVYLFSAKPDGELTGYVHGFSFRAAENGVSFGRHTTSDGKDHFVAQISPSFGSANFGPRIGPVLLNEIMYFPRPNGTNDNTLDEYVELKNVSPQPISLFHPAHPAARWRLRGGVDFDFPAAITLQPGELILLVSFDPATDPLVASSFRQKFGIPAAVRLLGPFQGKLSNRSERVSLQRPDAPEPADPTNIPFIVVDEVTYDYLAPWPTTASGTGASLQRFPATFAGDPLSWRAADPTPGRENARDLGDDDGDGLPNDWELAHGLDPKSALGINGASGDFDSDGMTNLQEFLAGTHPRNAQSRLAFIETRPNGTGLEMRFLAIAGRNYQILYTSDLSSPTWFKLMDVTAQPVTALYSFTDQTTGRGQTRFYKIQVQP